MRLLKWLVRVIVRLFAIVLIIPVIGLAYGWMTTADRAPTSRSQTAPAAISAQLREEIPGYQRPEAAAFQTYAERSVIHAAREYAAFVATRGESGFPYFGYIGRFWQDYAIVVRTTAPYPFDTKTHARLLAIGTAHTVELGLQWAWENSVGRLTEWSAGWRKTPQDHYLAATALEYAAFLDRAPWHRFDYERKRAGLWRSRPATTGHAAIRSWERKLAFGLSYSIKQTAAGLVPRGFEARADPTRSHIHVWAQGPVTTAIRGLPDTALERRLGSDGAVFITRRGQAFTNLAPQLVAKGIRFVEIGGNQDVLLTVLSETTAVQAAGVRRLFEHKLPADPARRRTGFIVPVSSLHVVLPLLASGGARLEQIYD